MILKIKPLNLLLCLALLASGARPGRTRWSQAFFKNDLLNNMVGAWQLSGTIMHRPVKHTIEAEWVLNHQFLRIHEKDAADAAPGEVPTRLW